MPRIARRGIGDESGSVAVEYALLAAFVGLGLVAAMTSTKSSLNGTYKRIASGVGNAGLIVTRCGTTGAGCADMSRPISLSNTNPDATKVLTSGWSDLEPGATWSIGATSVITLDLGNLVNTGSPTAQLDISATGMRNTAACDVVMPCVPVTMGISINGVDVGAMRYEVKQGITANTVTLNAAAMAAIAANDGKAVITLNVDNHGRPSDVLPGYGDVRDLGVFVSSIGVR